MQDILIKNIKTTAQTRYFGCEIARSNLEDIAMVKSLPHRYWNKQLKLWLVPYSKENWESLKSLFGSRLITQKKEQKLTLAKETNRKKPVKFF